MPRVQVYLPEDLYELLKSRGLPASEIFQRAVRDELRRRDLLRETDEYLATLTQEVGAPGLAERKRAATKADGLIPRPARRTG